MLYTVQHLSFIFGPLVSFTRLVPPFFVSPEATIRDPPPSPSLKMPVTRSVAAKRVVDDRDIPAKRLRSRATGLSDNDPIIVETLSNISSSATNTRSTPEPQIIPTDTAAPAHRRAVPKSRKPAAPKTKRKRKSWRKTVQDPSCDSPGVCLESSSLETEIQLVVSTPVLAAPSPATCIICLDRPKCVVFAPCGHNLMCETCATMHYEGAEFGGVKKNKGNTMTADTKMEIICPYCCQESDGWMKVFEV